MVYQQFQPHPTLSRFIDAYWTAEVGGSSMSGHKILPDGCVDILINLGEDLVTDGQFKMKNEQAYLVGTMTRFKYSTMPAGSMVLGIRFKPSGFAAFFKFEALTTLTDQTIEFDKKLAPGIFSLDTAFSNKLDKFFLSKLQDSRNPVTAIAETITSNHGKISVAELADTHYTTVRQLERSFKLHIGISPKELINITRYQFALEKIRQNSSEKSLMQIAYESAYYDHAHLSNEIKKYTGEIPSFF